MRAAGTGCTAAHAPAARSPATRAAPRQHSSPTLMRASPRGDACECVSACAPALACAAALRQRCDATWRAAPKREACPRWHASHALFAMSRRSSLPADTNFSPERSAEVSPIAGVAGRRGVATASPRARLSSPSPPPRTWLAQALSAVESGDVTAVKTLLARPGQVNPEVREGAFVCLGERRSTMPLTPGTAVPRGVAARRRKNGRDVAQVWR
jgi:hypothetical protein